MSDSAQRRLPGRVIALGAVIALSLAACIVAYLQGWLRPQTLREVATRAGSWGMAAFVAFNTLIVVLWLPRAWGLLASGVLFGPLWGCLLTIASDTISALVCYGIARRAGGEWTEQLLARRPRLAIVVDLLAVRRGGLTVALLRMCPVAHYTACSYAAGLAGVRPAPFALGNLVGLIPGAVLYPLFSDAVMRPGSLLFWVIIALVGAALVISVFVARKVWRMAQAAHATRQQEQAAALVGTDHGLRDQS